MNPNRRRFLRGTAGVAMAGAGALGLTFSPDIKAGGSEKTLVYVFLRGAMDGLSLIAPTGNTADANLYRSLRPTIALGQSGDIAPINLGGGFGMNPYADSLNNLFQRNKLAIIRNCGHPDGTYTRSHFDAQEQCELGTPGAQISQDGWLARHLSTTNVPANALFSALVSSSNPPVSLNGYTDVATLDSTGGFSPNDSPDRFEPTQLAMLQEMYQGNSSFDLAARTAVDAVELISTLDLGNYVTPGAFDYPNTGFANDMKLIAQLLSQQISIDGGPQQSLGITAATVDFGGWDDHGDIRPFDSFGRFARRIGELADGLRAFYDDMEARGKANDIAVVVQTEFGRQITENANRGVDHGLGAPMMVISGNVDNRNNGGAASLFGTWNGVSDSTSDSLIPRTDFRQVLATTVDGLMGNNNVGTVFPGLTYQPIDFLV